MFRNGFPDKWTTLKKLIWLKAVVLSGVASTIKTVTGTVPLTLANAVSHAIKSLTQYGKCTQASTPTPDAPVDIMCNNGAIKFGWHDIITTSQLSGYGTYVSPSQTATTRAYRWFRDLPNGTYTFAVSGDYEIIVQWRDPADPADGLAQGYENLTGWITSGEVTLGKTTGGYGIAVRRTSGTDSITPSNFDGILHVQERGLYIDGTTEVLTVRGVNLCNPAMYTGDGWYISANNTVSSAASNGTLVFPCKPNTTYSWWHTSGAGGARAFELTTDEVTAGQSATWAVGNPAYNDAMTVRKYMTSANAKLLCVLFARVADQVGRTIDEQLADFMLVEGDIEEAFAYQPYHEPQTASVPMLLSVGDTKDEVEIIGGVKTGKIGVKVLDGTEAWVKGTSFYADMSLGALESRHSCVCSHFVGKSTDSYTGDSNTIQVGYSVDLIFWNRIYITANRTTYATAADFKAWLAEQYAAGTPVIVLYPLAEETTEQGTAHNLHTSAGTNVVDVVSNVDPVELAVEYNATE